MATLSREELEQLNNYFNLANYLCIGQLYLLDNPLLRRPLKMTDIKPRLVGHFGTIPGQNFIFTHLNRIISKHNLNMIYIVGPGHGGQTAVTNAFLDGTYQSVYPEFSQDEEGIRKLFKQFSFPGGISSHVAPETPGSIHEGGELGYSLIHGFGAVLDNPNLIASVIVGDGEAETGPLATSWNINKFLNPSTDGVVLPIIHLNGYKISNPTVLSRMSKLELTNLFMGYGWKPYFVEVSDLDDAQELMATTMDKVIGEIKNIKKRSFNKELNGYANYPMIILKTKKGWTGPSLVEGSFKAHQVPLQIEDESSLNSLETWLRSYNIDALFEDNRIKSEILSFLPKGEMRMSANPNANGGLKKVDLILPDIKNYMLDTHYGEKEESDMYVLGGYLKDVIKYNESNKNFRIFSPDEAMSNRLNQVFDVTNRQWLMTTTDKDEFLSSYGRVFDSYLSEHFANGTLEGYLLTGRHGIVHSYEAFLRVVDSMIGLHAKWLKMCKSIHWRRNIASLNIISTSHVWQQDHNGYTHQEPGLINHVLNKKSDIVNVYLPYDANSLIYYVDKSLKSVNQINTIVASKHLRPQWLNKEETIKHCESGIGIWDFASVDNPDIVLACSGDTPTLEVMAATDILRKNTNIKVRVVNVVDLTKLKTIDNYTFNNIFTENLEVIFVFHGYKSVIESLLYDRNRKFIIKGYKEEGAITTPFDMRVLNGIDRYHIILDALKSLNINNEFNTRIKQILMDHYEHIRLTGKDLDEVVNWHWN